MTKLVRENLRGSFKAAKDAHPGLMLQRGWTDFVQTNADNAGANGKTEHIERICNIPAGDLYTRAYQRWMNTTSDESRFSKIAMKIDGRLLIGLTGGGALETGCAVSHTYGTPYLPGSSIKGIVRAWAEENMQDWKKQFDDLFGTTDLSGLVAFHDAWWIPDSGAASHKNHPFVADIVTPHHPEYYKGQGKPATDLDSPVPNALIGVRGSFLFVLEGNPMWVRTVQRMLEKALGEYGIGAKTRAGYGYLAKDTVAEKKAQEAAKQRTEAETFIRVRLHRNVGTGEIKAILADGKSTAPVKGDAAQALLSKLPEELRAGKKIKEGKLEVEATITSEGNMQKMLDIRQIAA